mgnify:CR=1 FL=1
MLGIKISKNGESVNTSDDNLAFSSDFFTPKIYKIKKYTSNTTEAHGLDYAPMFIALYNNALLAGTDVYTIGASVSVDSANVKVFMPSSATEVWVILFADGIE